MKISKEHVFWNHALNGSIRWNFLLYGLIKEIIFHSKRLSIIHHILNSNPIFKRHFRTLFAKIKSES